MQYTAWWLRRARGLAGWWVSQAGLGRRKDNCPSGLGQSVGHPSRAAGALPHHVRVRTCYCITMQWCGGGARARAGWLVGVPAGLGRRKDNCPSGLGWPNSHV